MHLGVKSNTGELSMTFRGGARLGLLNASWPFAQLTLSTDSIFLKVFSKEYILRKDEVKSLEYFRGWFSVGVKIIHTTAALDSHAVFWSFKTSKVLNAASRLGFPTRE